MGKSAVNVVEAYAHHRLEEALVGGGESIIFALCRRGDFRGVLRNEFLGFDGHVILAGSHVYGILAVGDFSDINGVFVLVSHGAGDVIVFGVLFGNGHGAGYRYERAFRYRFDGAHVDSQGIERKIFEHIFACCFDGFLFAVDRHRGDKIAFRSLDGDGGLFGIGVSSLVGANGRVFDSRQIGRDGGEVFAVIEVLHRKSENTVCASCRVPRGKLHYSFGHSGGSADIVVSVEHFGYGGVNVEICAVAHIHKAERIPFLAGPQLLHVSAE